MSARAARPGRRRLLRHLVGPVFALLPAAPGLALEEGLRELQLPQEAVEREVKAETDGELPPPTFPVSHVDQNPFHGAWHEFVNVTTGGLVFRMADLKVAGRMPIDFGRIYDSKVSDSLPPPPPGGPEEARWTEDLGKNWVLGYTAYLIPNGTGFTMATADGDLVRWTNQGGGLYLPYNATASKHLKMQSTGPMTLVETLTDGTTLTFTLGVANGSTHALTKIQDRSGNAIDMIYGQGRLVEIRNSDGESLFLYRENVNPGLFPVARVTRVADEHGREVHFNYNTLGAGTDEQSRPQARLAASISFVRGEEGYGGVLKRPSGGDLWLPFTLPAAWSLWVGERGGTTKSAATGVHNW